MILDSPPPALAWTPWHIPGSPSASVRLDAAAPLAWPPEAQGLAVWVAGRLWGIAPRRCLGTVAPEHCGVP